MKNNWIFIDSGYKSGFYNIAADEEILSFEKPVLRIYGFKPYCITLGYSMNADDALNRDYIIHKGFDITRRMTGGKAVLHGDEITYSLAAPLSFFGKSVVNAYEKSSLVLEYAYRQCGIVIERAGENEKGNNPICFAEKSKYEVSAGGKKLAGFAQKKCGDKILQHCSIPLNVDFSVLKNCFSLEEGEANELADKISAVNLLSKEFIAYAAFKNYLLEGFKKIFHVDFEITDFSAEQEKNIYERVNRKYILPCWVMRK